jgi:hypothetical protein
MTTLFPYIYIFALGLYLGYWFRKLEQEREA